MSGLGEGEDRDDKDDIRTVGLTVMSEVKWARGAISTGITSLALLALLTLTPASY